MNEDCKTDILDLLLSKAPQYPTKKLKMNRLSEELDAEVVFEIRALSFNQIDDYIRNKDDSEINIILEGLVSPDIKDDRLLKKFGALTPGELLRDPRFLRPGEVLKLAVEIERLSGYSDKIFEEIAKN
ncbi:MAG: hypothetical protein RR142_06585 [Clostridia bacterium]